MFSGCRRWSFLRWGFAVSIAHTVNLSRQLHDPGVRFVQTISSAVIRIFPKRWLDATLGGHRSASAAQTVRQFLADHPDLSPRLRGKVLQSADGLFRAAGMVEGVAL